VCGLHADVVARPFRTLSVGEQHLASLARTIGMAGSRSHIVCFDEFTSVLDRATAHKVCLRLSEYVRQGNVAQIIVATVHEDVADWLDVDWVLQSKSGAVRIARRPRQLQEVVEAGHIEEFRQPKLHLQLRVLRPNRDSQEVFSKFFAEHHYMQGGLPSVFHGLVLRDSATDRMVAFHGIALLPGQYSGGITRRESRMVVLPEYQGFGIGPKLSETVGEMLLESNLRFFSMTHHPRLGGQRNHSFFWRPVDGSGKAGTSLSGVKCQRLAYRHQYMGKGDQRGNDHLKPDSQSSASEAESAEVLTPQKAVTGLRAFFNAPTLVSKRKLETEDEARNPPRKVPKAP
ncbi:unnamed protein product, partial [Symbiodinium necroappetens]